MADEKDPEKTPGERDRTGRKPWSRPTLTQHAPITCWRCEQVGRGATRNFVLAALAPSQDTKGNIFIKESLVCISCLLLDNQVTSFEGNIVRVS